MQDSVLEKPGRRSFAIVFAAVVMVLIVFSAFASLGVGGGISQTSTAGVGTSSSSTLGVTSVSTTTTSATGKLGAPESVGIKSVDPVIKGGVLSGLEVDIVNNGTVPTEDVTLTALCNPDYTICSEGLGYNYHYMDEYGTNTIFVQEYFALRPGGERVANLTDIYPSASQAFGPFPLFGQVTPLQGQKMYFKLKIDFADGYARTFDVWTTWNQRAGVSEYGGRPVFTNSTDTSPGRPLYVNVTDVGSALKVFDNSTGAVSISLHLSTSSSNASCGAGCRFQPPGLTYSSLSYIRVFRESVPANPLYLIPHAVLNYTSSCQNQPNCPESVVWTARFSTATTPITPNAWYFVEVGIVQQPLGNYPMGFWIRAQAG